MAKEKDQKVQLFFELEASSGTRKNRKVIIERVQWTHLKDKRPRYWITIKSIASERVFPNVTRNDLQKIIDSIDEMEETLKG